MQANIKIHDSGIVMILIQAENPEEDLAVELAGGMEEYALVFQNTRPEIPSTEIYELPAETDSTEI